MHLSNTSELAIITQYRQLATHINFLFVKMSPYPTLDRHIFYAFRPSPSKTLLPFVEHFFFIYIIIFRCTIELTILDLRSIYFLRLDSKPIKHFSIYIRTYILILYKIQHHTYLKVLYNSHII